MSRFAIDSLSQFCAEHEAEMTRPEYIIIPIDPPRRRRRVKRNICRVVYWLSGAFAGAIFIAFTYDKIPAYPAGLLMGLCLVLAGLTGCKGGIFK